MPRGVARGADGVPRPRHPSRARAGGVRAPPDGALPAGEVQPPAGGRGHAPAARSRRSRSSHRARASRDDARTGTAPRGGRDRARAARPALGTAHAAAGAPAPAAGGCAWRARRPRTTPDLAAIDRLLALSVSSAEDEHLRLRPLVLDIARQRLADHTGVRIEPAPTRPPRRSGRRPGSSCGPTGPCPATAAPAGSRPSACAPWSSRSSGSGRRREHAHRSRRPMPAARRCSHRWSGR